VENVNSEHATIANLDDRKPKNNDEEGLDEIGLIDLFAVLWRRKVMIITITVLAMVAILGFLIASIILPSETSPLPNQYTSNAYMLITDARVPAGDNETLLGLGFRRGPTYSGLAMFLLGSNSLFDSVIDAFEMIGLSSHNEYPKILTRGMLRSGLLARYNENSGVLTVSFTNTDPVFTRDVVNLTVAHLENRFTELGINRNRAEMERLELHLAEVFQNILMLDEERRRLEHSVAFTPLGGGALPAIMADINRATMESNAMQQVYTQLRVQQEALRATIATEIPMFQVLELAEVPYTRSGPSRIRPLIIVTLGAGLFAVFLAFVLELIYNIRNDPVAMAKLAEPVSRPKPKKEPKPKPEIEPVTIPKPKEAIIMTKIRGENV